ncbi:MAG: cysteine-rich small domain-containing protein [Bacteroides sp.]|nr:cysteine-rich small domain-containing protein [Bacteroides sp.]MCM1550315.1 cysteine-rich small domain-containing protein [Clostridium sp.]
MKQYMYVQNQKCEYFPCHSGIKEDEFNCLFCYCPLYGLKEECGGDFVYLENGVKDCSGCRIPHERGGYEFIQQQKKQMLELGKRKQE